MKRSRKPERKLTRLDVEVLESVQNHSHLSTADVLRKREMIKAEVEAAESELTELAARNADVRARRAKAEATLAGITQVLACRS